MKLIDLIPANVDSISINGMSKNAGKTTVLKQLLQEYYHAHRQLGIVSIGVDGERYDVWSGLPKPAIHVEPGMIVATSRLAIEEADARFEILEQIKHSSIGHEVYLVRTVKGGRVKLTGTPSLHDTRAVLQGFRYYGVNMTLIDGAYDRISSSNPDIAAGSILVVGAAYHRSLSVILDHLHEWIYRYTIPVYHPTLSLQQLLTGEQAVWIPENHTDLILLPAPLAPGWSNKLSGKASLLYLPGSCTGAILQEAGTFRQPPTILLRDGTRLFAKWRDISDFYRRGGEIRVLRPSSLLGIAVNPYAPDGYSFDPDYMLEQVKQVSKHIPVFDVIRGTLLT